MVYVLESVAFGRVVAADVVAVVVVAALDECGEVRGGEAGAGTERKGVMNGVLDRTSSRVRTTVVDSLHAPHRTSVPYISRPFSPPPPTRMWVRTTPEQNHFGCDGLRDPGYVPQNEQHLWLHRPCQEHRCRNPPRRNWQTERLQQRGGTALVCPSSPGLATSCRGPTYSCDESGQSAAPPAPERVAETTMVVPVSRCGVASRARAHPCTVVFKIPLHVAWRAADLSCTRASPYMRKLTYARECRAGPP
ncbi:hypothetical protein BD413DRAFT_280625 [Trametes elegans]|nr:hypothetical protein BD413DRAFT_280625 [Trametes elegans]